MPVASRSMKRLIIILSMFEKDKPIAPATIANAISAGSFKNPKIALSPNKDAKEANDSTDLFMSFILGIDQGHLRRHVNRLVM